MAPFKKDLNSRKRAVKGCGLVGSVLNKVIDALPIELHLPGGYRYCGPGTRLQERLKRGDPGINGLDEACKEHDIAYSLYKDNFKRKLADQSLAESAWKRFKSPDASLGEKAAAWAVTTAMKAKAKLGGELKKKKKKNAGRGMVLKPHSGRGNAKRGGVLPLVPIFAGLSALGSMIGGVSTAVKNARGSGLRIKRGKGVRKRKADKPKKTNKRRQAKKKNSNKALDKLRTRQIR